MLDRIQEIGFKKFGMELLRVVGLHQILAGNVITYVLGTTAKLSMPFPSSGVVVILERNTLLRLRPNCN